MEQTSPCMVWMRPNSKAFWNGPNVLQGPRVLLGQGALGVTQHSCCPVKRSQESCWGRAWTQSASLTPCGGDHCSQHGKSALGRSSRRTTSFPSPGSSMPFRLRVCPGVATKDETQTPVPVAGMGSGIQPRRHPRSVLSEWSFNMRAGKLFL